MDLTTYALLKQQIGNASSFTEEDATKLNKVIQDVEELSGQTINREEFAEMLKSLVDANDNDKIDTIEEIANWISGEDSRFAEKLATDPMMEDWTTGKTVDAAVLKNNFEDALAALGEKPDIANLAQVAFSGDYEDLVNKPVEPEITTYDIQFNGSMGLGMGKFVFTNTEDNNEVICEKLRNGTANINRIINLTYDPMDSISSSLAFEDYELYDVKTSATTYTLFYKRVITFQSMQFNNPQLDTLYITYNINSQAFTIYHSYHALAPSIIFYSDIEFADQPYPHAIKFSNAGGRWGKTNLATVKNTRAGFSSDFNFILRVTTHGDNVWLRPTETVSVNALPRFIGESEKLGKRIIVTFDDWTDSGNPTGTIDMEDLPHKQIQSDWNQADETALDYIKNKPQQITEQNVADWGFTKNTGTYVKPANGIPASDLANGVLPVFTNNDDGIETINGDLIVAMYDDKGNRISTTIAEKYTKPSSGIPASDLAAGVIPTVPTKVSDLTNDSGYQTAAQVQTAIAAIPAELPAVTASDNGKFLCVVDGAWAAIEIPSAESASFGGDN